ncbi:MAG: sigma 54-interacting transcriptional regulator [Archangiaceae bacterium]|nr:sigma 54-interacting transcriptional regulator [Archangiaceae bacterium]
MTKAQLETEQLDRKSIAATPGRWRLVVLSESGTSSHALPAQGTVTLGRGEDADIKLDDASASRRHAMLHLGPEVRLEDLGSSNGTVVRGKPFKKQSIELGAGDSIELGKTIAVLQPDELSDRVRPWTLLSHPQFLEKVAQARAPFAMLRLQVQARAGVAQEVLSKELDGKNDVVASFGPGMFEILAEGRDGAAAKALGEKVSARLVAAGARVRLGHASAPTDGKTAEDLMVACSRPAAAASPGFVVRDDAMAALYRLVDRIAPSNLSVLVLGETGAGKEVLAGEIHKRSKRNGKPFLRLNCAALHEQLLESELFGHVKGAFTGADRNREGLLESANGGTVFLDEIGEISAAVQAKLLRVLEERLVMPVGSNDKRPIDVRFIFATNRDLEAEVARAAFRSDLFFRINGISLVIPPLRERLTEIEPLARAFVAEACAKDQRPVPELSPDALATLRAYPWPGNIRELKSVIDRAVLFASETGLSGEAIAQAIGVKGAGPVAAAPTNLREERDAAEKRAVLEALEKCDGNQTRAAELLGVSRRTLVTRLQQYGMTRSRKK